MFDIINNYNSIVCENIIYVIRKIVVNILVKIVIKENCKKNYNI